MRRVTSLQIYIAQQYGIPKKQAHTINVGKVKDYQCWLRSCDGIVERALNKIQDDNNRKLKLQWIRGSY